MTPAAMVGTRVTTSEAISVGLGTPIIGAHRMSAYWPSANFCSGREAAPSKACSGRTAHDHKGLVLVWPLASRSALSAEASAEHHKLIERRHSGCTPAFAPLPSRFSSRQRTTVLFGEPNMTGKLSAGLHEQEIKLLTHLRAVQPGRTKTTSKFSLGDRIAATMGSWSFIIIQSVLLAIWIALNVTAFVRQWDPYPFILLNLALSFQAAYAAPVIMMSQNRQAALAGC